jgi:hypothetical protein
VALAALLALACSCADARDVGRLVHDDAFATEGRWCFAAMSSLSDDDRLMWARIDEAPFGELRRRGPRLPGIRSLAHDEVSGELLAAGQDGTLRIPLGTEGVAQRRPSDFPIDIAWPVPRGEILIGTAAGGLARWQHIGAADVVSRTLPHPLSLWREGDWLLWLAASHPRRPGPVLLRGSLHAPLETARIVPSAGNEGRFHPTSRVAALPGGRIAVASIEVDAELAPAEESAPPGRHLVVDVGERRQRFRVDGRHVEGLVWLGDLVFLVAQTDPDQLLLVDLDSNHFQQLDGLRGPVAGPLPCASTIPLP